MTSLPIERWSDFYLAQVGAAGALAGLVIVAVSINLARILEQPQLPGRAAETLIQLVAVLVLASLGLAPDQPGWAVGGEAVLTGLLALGVSLRLQSRSWRRGDPPEWRWPRLIWALMANAPLATGGALLIRGDAVGLYWIAGGMILSLLAGVANAWVLLVEILR